MPLPPSSKPPQSIHGWKPYWERKVIELYSVIGNIVVLLMQDKSVPVDLTNMMILVCHNNNPLTLVMNRWLLFSIISVLSMFLSCTKMGDSELGEFQSCERSIDMTQKNKYEETLFCNDWIISKVYYETFVDGDLQSKEDQTNKWIGHKACFRIDHSMTYGGCFGSWLYAHNYLMWRYSDVYQVAEVLLLTKEDLHFQTEFLPSGIPFFQDKSGTHCFWVYEYRAKH